MIDLLTALSIWTGAVVGVLKMIDWLLSAKKKDELSELFISLWNWLDDQRAGRFIAALRSLRTQRIFALAGHFFLLIIAVGYMLREYYGWRINAELELGHPRVYKFQGWVDIAAILVSAAMLTFRFHPRLARWIAAAPSLPGYFRRAATAWASCFGLMLLLLILQLPIIGFSSPAFDNPLEAGDPVLGYERMLGGKVGVIAVHALTAFVAAPVVAEGMLMSVVLIYSLQWLLTVLTLMAWFKVGAFVLVRVAESKEGPVMGISGLLIGLGFIAKGLLGK